MYFSRVTLGPDADPRSLLDRNGYREHQVLWSLFEAGVDAQRDFIFRRDEQHPRPRYYVVSARLPAENGLWHVDTKEYAPQLQAGQSLMFNLRANPVVTRSDGDGRSRRNDLIMDIKKQSGWQQASPADRPALADLIQQAGEQWLMARQERIGVRIDSLLADAYRRHRAYKRGQQRPIRYSTVDLSGMLTVVDCERMHAALLHGVGPAKAFGCGLLLVRSV